MASRPLNAIHLCSGYGGFELALRSLGRVQTVCHVEWDAYAAAVLVERMAQERLDPAPVWDDLSTFDGRPWRGRVDVITAGFPCQPFSQAGKHRGTDDDRWLWPQIARVLGEVEPSYVILENVTNVIKHGLPEILHGLAALGFDAEWGCLSAAAVGATHKRERFWLLGYRDRRRLQSEWQRPDGSSERVHGHVDRSGETVGVADTESFGLHSRNGSAFERSLGVAGDSSCGAAVGVVADAPDLSEREPDHEACTVARSDSRGDAGGRSHCFPPGRDDRAGWEQWIDAGGPQPVLRRVTDGTPGGLVESLHLGGNGLVPQCAAEAIGQLIDRTLL